MNQPLLEKFRKAYQDLELFPLIQEEAIGNFRVNNFANETIAKLEQAVEDAPAGGKLIFAGHRGCGKSTLLFKFKQQMERHNKGYVVVFFSVADYLEMSDVNHVNILYCIALNLLYKATMQDIEINPETRNSLLDWFTTTQTDTYSSELKAEVEGNGNFFNFITAKLKSESTFRQEIQKTYQRRVSDLAKKADEIVALIQQATKKKVLVIIDDLDKLDLNLAEDIYKSNINSLFLPKFQIIYTIPISAIRNHSLYGTLTAAPARTLLMAVAKFFKPGDSHKSDAVPKESLVELFLKILEKRIPQDLLEPETARKIVLNSGGVLRELVRITRECCSQCLLLVRAEPERTDIKINDDILKLAIRDLRNDFTRPLGENLFKILVETYHKNTPQDATSEDFLNLLHGLFVLEYENDDLWYDVHPIVIEILKRKNLITTD